MRYLNGDTNLKALEINSLATYSPKEFFSVYDEVIYPQIDMTAMPYPDESYDVVLHSDTLEHIPDPIKGLQAHVWTQDVPSMTHGRSCCERWCGDRVEGRRALR
jgi:hypothetical protein